MSKSLFPLKNIKQFLDLTDVTPEDLEQEVIRKQYTFDLTIDESDERSAVADVSVKQVDHDGDIVVPENADFSVFEKNPIVLWSHQYNEPPVGKATAVVVKDDRIQMKMKFAETEKGCEIWELVKGGFLKACSIGFLIKKALYRGTKEFAEYVKEKGLQIDESVQRIVTDFMVIENSICSIPANSDALISAVSAKSLELSDKIKKDLNIEIKEEIEGINEVVTEIIEEKEETEETDEEKEEKEEKESFNCECIECGYKETSDQHCNELTCPECGGEMRRAERPGPGQPSKQPKQPKELEQPEAKNKEETEKTDEPENIEEVDEPEEPEMIDPEVEQILMEMRDDEIAAEVTVVDTTPELPELKKVLRVGGVDIKQEIKNFRRKRKGRIV